MGFVGRGYCCFRLFGAICHVCSVVCVVGVCGLQRILFFPFFERRCLQIGKRFSVIA